MCVSVHKCSLYTKINESQVNVNVKYIFYYIYFSKESNTSFILLDRLTMLTICECSNIQSNIALTISGYPIIYAHFC